jgi:hypothetical protein
VYEAAYRVGYDLVIITLTPLPRVVAITAAVVLTYLAYRPRARSPKRRAWSAIFAVLALYGFSDTLAPAEWDEPLVLPGVTFAALLAGYVWLDPARGRPWRVPRKRLGGRGWFD